MSITDELREWVRHIGDNQHLGILTDFGKQGLTNLADRIDAEHRKALEKVAAMVDHDGLVELPKDADGETIHVGDVVVEDGCGVPYTVMSMTLFEDCWDVGECGMNPNLCRHVHPDTWERIIEDAANLVRGDNESVVELVERCRRLAGEE